MKRYVCVVALGAVGVCAAACEGVAHARCPDPSTLVVGDRCKVYGVDDDGAWSGDFLPPLIASLSMRSLSYAPKGGTSFDGRIANSPLAYSFPATRFGASERTYGVEGSLAWLPVRYAYVGLAMGAGTGHWAPPAFTANGLSISSQGTLDATLFNLDAFVGLRLPLGIVSVRSEMAVGGSSLTVTQYANSGGNALTATATAWALLLEPRVSLDWWFTPKLTLSVVGAMPAFTPEATDVGIAFAVHTRVLDGG